MKRIELTRRAMLAAGVAPMFVPSRLLGAGAPSNRLNLAAIGVGGRGFGNCWHNFARFEDVRFVAAVDCFAGRRQKFADQCNRKYGSNVCRPMGDFGAALQRDDVDGVVISTPDHWHVPIAVAAARAGKDLYVEKPLGVAMAWAKTLRQAAERGVVFQYGTQQRSMKSSQIAVDLVRNGHVGKIQRIEIWSPALGRPRWGDPTPAEVPAGLDYEQWIGPAPMKPYCHDRCRNHGAYHIYDYALGFIAGWGAHPLDLMQWAMTGDDTSPVVYHGTGKIAAGGLADTTWTWDVRCEYPSGVPVRFMSADVARPIVEQYHPRFRSDGTTFFGDDGWVSVSRGACYMQRGGKMVNTSQVEFGPDAARVYSGDHHARNFLDCMKTRQRTVNPLESAIRGDAISHLADIAVRTGRTIRWDPVAETIVGDDGAAKLLDRPTRGA